MDANTNRVLAAVARVGGAVVRDEVGDIYSIDLGDCIVDAALSDTIGEIDTVKKLHLSECGLIDIQVKLLRGMPELRMLNLGLNPITDDCLPSLALFQQLRELHLFHTQICGKTLPSLTHLPLEVLTLEGTSADDSVAGSLSQMHELRELDLAATGLTDEGLRQISGLGRLRELNISMTACTFSGMDQFMELFAGTHNPIYY